MNVCILTTKVKASSGKQSGELRLIMLAGVAAMAFLRHLACPKFQACIYLSNMSDNHISPYIYVCSMREGMQARNGGGSCGMVSEISYW